MVWHRDAWLVNDTINNIDTEMKCNSRKRWADTRYGMQFPIFTVSHGHDSPVGRERLEPPTERLEKALRNCALRLLPY